MRAGYSAGPTVGDAKPPTRRALSSMCQWRSEMRAVSIPTQHPRVRNTLQDGSNRRSECVQICRGRIPVQVLVMLGRSVVMSSKAVRVRSWAPVRATAGLLESFCDRLTMAHGLCPRNARCRDAVDSSRYPVLESLWRVLKTSSDCEVPICTCPEVLGQCAS